MKYGYMYFDVDGKTMTLGNVVVNYEIPSTELAVALEGEPVEYIRGGKTIKVTRLADPK
jgi:sulfur carrier protein ThiS